MFKGLFDFKNQKLHFNMTIIVPVIGFIILGLIVLSSTSDLDSISSTFYKQIFWMFIGSIFFIIMQYVRVQFLYDYSYIFYILLILLIFSTVFAPIIGGAKSWFVFGSCSSWQGR